VSNGRPTLLILGTRGIPANHKGFETFAEKLALFLTDRWNVKVYCQHDVARVERRFRSETWHGIELIHVQVASTGPRATLEFDLHCILDSLRRKGVCLVLGYNSAVFLPILRLLRRPILTNMDGIEWRRPKWSRAVRAWFWINEWIAAWTSHRLVADHPVIADHLATRRSRKAIATIPYGGNPVVGAPEAPVRALGLEPDRYMVSIARIEPDNNILTIVKAFSNRHRGAKLVVLGTLDDSIAYHREVRAAASDEVIFPGAIYEQATVEALRFHARAYLHGHTVGGTNPSLVEALWAGCPVIAHDNPFNRGTAGEAQAYFGTPEECERRIATCLADDEAVRRAREAARQQATRFSWEDILSQYESELSALGGYGQHVLGSVRLDEIAPEGMPTGSVG
jgi:glycosyltransferase involved in cell wall biosynthesis